MPIHDWTAVSAGTFHNFHFLWTATLATRLNSGLLPAGFFAMAEQVVGGPEADVLTLQARQPPEGDIGGVALAAPPPTATFVFPAAQESERYARKARRIAIHHALGNVVAVIEIVSPGNKNSRHALRAFVAKAADLIWQGVNLLVIDLFPPGPRDPQGIHPAIWEEIGDQPFALPPGKPLTLASYQAAPTRVAYVEPVAVGERLPHLALFLHEAYYIRVPLEETYETTWNSLPGELRQLLVTRAES
jgi:hypothetical protein